tara:strand:- start:414 stop:1019 length:606 start_codon:yes stop_codon:yes gene_type:complete
MSRQDELTRAITEADEYFKGSVSAVPFMKLIASAETDYGRTDLDPNALSYGPFQIDPIRYFDITQAPGRMNEKHKKRLSRANEYLRKKLNDPEFDISKLAVYNPETQDYVKESRNLKYLRNPDVGAVLTRLALKQRPEQIPQGIENMVSGYEKIWGPKWSQSKDASILDKKRKEARDKFVKYNTEESVMTENDKVNSAFNF